MGAGMAWPLFFCNSWAPKIYFKHGLRLTTTVVKATEDR